ncbi:Pre-rRNA-processing protein TSR2-domain-containing protein [Pilaira anomala]|nr:Pre-rRNA-processing protein TSR2-domain-containing protein [Pilaira anomala]
MSAHPNKLAFEEGVSYIFHNWTALKLAVEQDWGGVESVEKREWFIDTVVDYFDKHGKKLDVDDIEVILSQIMTDEFNVTLEDDSPYLVAKHLFLLYSQCVSGNFEELERLRERSKIQNSFIASSCVKGGDDSDEEDEEDEEEVNTNNQKPEDKDEDMEEEPTVDADGWEIVRRK